ncbi:tau-tubulin kinase 2-like [Corticium candelabrum]|uniref:tau-tubulin kinase 2-like n=1 Tax=Corticium candelabrum TaxID=121492 RepID=UPI002E26271D|nr:tau-tubulin kinase 2-like [Corticium candelabrum]
MATQDSGVVTGLANESTVIRDRWKIVKKVGGGGFGEIYEGIDEENGERVAVKLEAANQAKQVLRMEVAVLKRLQGFPHVCKFFGCGRNSRFNYMVMSLQGPNLAELRRQQPHGIFSSSTTLRIGVQALKAIRCVHQCGFLHRDIKPSNFAVGSSSKTSNVLYILDFGLSRQFLDSAGKLRVARTVAGFRGTVRYASVNAHKSKELGRHDDIISLFYMLVEFTIGQLPWRKLKEKEVVGKIKSEFDHSMFLKELPSEFGPFWHHLKGLTYEQKPDFSLLLSLLHKAIIGRGYKDTDRYDWEKNWVDGSITTTTTSSVPLAAAAANSEKKKGGSKVVSRGTSFGPRGQPTPLGAVRQVTSHSAQSVGSLAEDLNGSMDKQEQEQHDAREQCYIDDVNMAKNVQNIENNSRKSSPQSCSAPPVSPQDKHDVNNNSSGNSSKKSKESVSEPSSRQQQRESSISAHRCNSQSSNAKSSKQTSSISDRKSCLKSTSEHQRSTTSNEPLKLPFQPRPPPGKASRPCLSARLRRFHVQLPDTEVT